MKQSKLYLWMPEMRIFWFFILLVLGVLMTAFFELRPILKIVSTAILAGIGFIVFVSTQQLARRNLERNVAYARLESVIANLRDGVIVYDPGFRIYIFNSAAERILNLKASDVVGQTFTLKLKEGVAPSYQLLLLLLFPALAPTVIRRTEPGAYPQVTDFSFESPPLELRVTTSEVRDEEGFLVGYMKVVRDRTRELALLRAKREFVTIASHQLRTPLTGIEWSWEALASEPLAPEAQSLVRTGRETTANLIRIVEDILRTAQIEEGRFGYQFSEMDLVPLAAELIREREEAARGQNITFSLAPPPGEPSLTLTADPEKLRIALGNLMDNALKYNVQGGEVAVSIQRLPNEPYALVRVRDTGLGIAPETMPKLFTKFFRGEEVKDTQVNGSGLGLYIVRNIIRRHGGKIWAESTPKRGSTFSFTLPTDPNLIPPKEVVYEEE